MKRFVKSLPTLLLTTLLAACQSTPHYDVAVIGGGTSGVAAAITAARQGADVLLIEEGPWLGGMLTSAGVSATDGNFKLRGGLWGEFRDSLEAHYGGPEALKTGWVSNILFEPSVGNAIFQHMVAAQPTIDLKAECRLSSFERREGRWHFAWEGAGSSKATASILIDATELGDVAAALGIPYDLGMESKALTGEEDAPEEAYPIIQDLTLVALLKEYPTDQTIPCPEGYDPDTFACCSLNPRCITPTEPNRMWPVEMMLSYGRLPGGKYMINWPIEGNDYYLNMVEASPEERAEAIREAKLHTLRFLYFIQTELGYNHLGLADDEFPTEDRLPLIPYHRESRRIRGEVRFTLEHVMHPYDTTLYRTAIAVGDYPVDQHHACYRGAEPLPDLHFHPVPPYGVPLGVLIPREQEGLIVAEKSISVSNLVNGSTRLQPVVLQLGEAAGTLAALAAREGKEPREVSVRAVQEELVEGGGYLLPLRDLPTTDPRFKPLQRIVATGILSIRGEHVGWENLSWADIDRTISQAELSEGLHRIFPAFTPCDNATPVDSEALTAWIAKIEPGAEETLRAAAEKWAIDLEAERSLTRIECALLIDQALDPFHRVEVDLQGSIIPNQND